MAEATLDHEALAEGEPARWLYVLHGIYGAGRNWSSLVRRLVRERPDLGALLVDLRQHGGSQGFPPPHTLAAAADDLRGLASSTGREPEVVIGHSFGGKVALEYAATAPPGLAQIWVVDSTPGAREPAGSAWEMLGVLRDLPGPFEEREEAVSGLEERGVERAIARWMATNLERAEGGYRWRIDFDEMEELLRDFFRRDLWPLVEAPPGDVTIHFVRAEESGILQPGDEERIEAAGRSTGRVRLHRVAGGHWVNADNPDALLELLVDELPRG